MTHFALETASLGYIRTLTLNPGHFRIDVTAPHKHNFAAPADSKYKPLYNFYTEIRPKLHGAQPGDPKKLAELTVELVRGEGVAAGRTLPSFLLLGSDAYAEVKWKSGEALKMLEEWESVIRSTDIE